jgi:hypothetical protein
MNDVLEEMSSDDIQPTTIMLIIITMTRIDTRPYPKGDSEIICITTAKK